MATERNLVLDTLTVNGTATINGELIVKNGITNYTVNSSGVVEAQAPIGSIVYGKFNKQEFVNKTDTTIGAETMEPEELEKLTEKELIEREKEQKYINSNYWTQLFITPSETPLTTGKWLCEASIRLLKTTETGLSSQICLIDTNDIDKLIGNQSAAESTITGDKLDLEAIKDEDSNISLNDNINTIKVSDTKGYNSLYTPKGFAAHHNLSCFIDIPLKTSKKFILLINTSVSAELDSKLSYVKFTKIL